MDKKTLSKICLVCVLTMAGGTAYAATAFTGTTVSGNSGTFSTSSNVYIDAVSSGTQYAAGSQHKQGDRYYFTNSSNPAFYYSDAKTKGTTAAIISSATQTTPTGYSSL